VLLPAFVQFQNSRAPFESFPVDLPFLIVDIAVSNILMAMGRSWSHHFDIAPLKLFLFVAVQAGHACAWPVLSYG